MARKVTYKEVAAAKVQNGDCGRSGMPTAAHHTWIVIRKPIAKKDFEFWIEKG